MGHTPKVDLDLLCVMQSNTTQREAPWYRRSHCHRQKQMEQPFFPEYAVVMDIRVTVTKWIKSCLLQCFGTFKMPILMFISVLVFRPEGQM